MRQYVLSAALVAVVAACGATRDAKEVKPMVTEESAKAEGSSLPAATIVKVPVDAQGKELHDLAEMRLVNGQVAMTGDAVEASFASAAAPKAVVDELDQSTSTESYCGWVGYNNSFRTSYYSNTSWNWAYYRPVYLNYGYNYSYRYTNVYSRGCSYSCYTCYNACGQPQQRGYTYSSYNYYYYSSSFSQNGYSGTGWNPGVSYQSSETASSQQSSSYQSYGY